MAKAGRDHEEEERRRAIADLERAAAQSEVYGSSSLRRQADRARAHFSGADADPDDRIEVWGRRIGRGLSVIGFTAVLIYLVVTYL